MPFTAGSRADGERRYIMSIVKKSFGKLPDGRERLFIQYSDRCDKTAPRVNVMHRFMELE